MIFSASPKKKGRLFIFIYPALWVRFSTFFLFYGCVVPKKDRYKLTYALVANLSLNHMVITIREVPR